jgi:nitrogen fixation protein FixH
MNSKSLLLLVIILIGVIGIFGWKIKSASSPSSKDAISLSTEPNPLQLGQNTFVITVRNNEGKTVDNAEVFFDLNMTAMNMGTQQGNATPMGNGKYSAKARLTMKGPWKVTTKVTMPDGNQVKKDFTVNVP